VIGERPAEFVRHLLGDLFSQFGRREPDIEPTLDFVNLRHERLAVAFGFELVDQFVCNFFRSVTLVFGRFAVDAT
jgi:hypothetical protein